MMTAAATPDAMPDDPVTLLSHLPADAIRARMDELEAEQRALRVLLRSALARERALARRRGGASARAGENGHEV
jgi:hypothetical protein